MPNTMPGNSMRGYLIEQIETLFADANKDLKTLLGHLSEQEQHFVRILTRAYDGMGPVLDDSKPRDAAYLRHLQADWFGRAKKKNGDWTKKKRWRGRWWRGTYKEGKKGGYQPIDSIVRGSFWTALKLREKYTPRPKIRVIWICAGHHFEGHILDLKEQITLILQTPHEGSPVEAVPMAEAGPFAEDGSVDESIYVVRDHLSEEEQKAGGYDETGAIGKSGEEETPPGFPMGGSFTVGYYHPRNPDDPI